MLRRSLIGGIILAVLLVVAGLVAYLTRPQSPTSVKPPPSSTSAPESSPSPGATGDKGVAVATPPKTSDPIVFAKAATKVLWTYDTLSFSQAEHLAGLKR